jgi:hypothetical protein
MVRKDAGTSNMKIHALKCGEGGEDVSSLSTIGSRKV